MKSAGPWSRKGDLLGKGLLFMLAAFAAGRTPWAASLPDRAVPQSCGMQLKGGDCGAGTLDDIRNLGVKCVRKGIYWSSVEKKKGVYDFGWCDEFIRDVVEERGFRLLACLFSGNKLYEDPKPGGIRTPAGRKGFADFAAALAERYRDHNVIWEIWNEPNVRTFWGRHGKAQHNSDEYAGEYTALVKEVVPAMRKADPDCIVLAGSVSNLWSASYQWIEYCFKHGMNETGISGWSLHPYSVQVESYPEAYGKVRDILTKYGAADLPLLNSERGFPTKKAEGWAGGDSSNASKQLQYHAWHFVRQYLVDLMCDVRLTIWYQWKGGGFGMIQQGKPTPACEACKVMVSQLSGYRFKERLPADSRLDFLLIFEKGSGERKLVAWTAPPPKQSPDKAKLHDVHIPVAGGARSVPVCGIYGERSSTAVAGGVMTLTLSGAPQYVELRAGTGSKGSAPIARPDGSGVALAEDTAARRRPKRKPRVVRTPSAAEPPAATKDPEEPPEAGRLLKEGETLFVDGELEAAGAIFERIIEEHPGTPSAAKARKYVELLE